MSRLVLFESGWVFRLNKSASVKPSMVAYCNLLNVTCGLDVCVCVLPHNFLERKPMMRRKYTDGCMIDVDV